MANCLFPAFIGAGDACEQLGLCKVQSHFLISLVQLHNTSTTIAQHLHFSCTTINSKVKSGLGDWTCDDCTDIMTRVAAFMVKPETIEQGLAVLNVSKQFCLL